MKDFHDLHTHLSCKRDLTGSLERISSMSSWGMKDNGRRRDFETERAGF